MPNEPVSRERVAPLAGFDRIGVLSIHVEAAAQLIGGNRGTHGAEL
jgi:hypothetical protein